MSDEVSAGGSRIYRHSQSSSESERISGGDPVLIEGVHAHIAKNFPGAVGSVLHELVSPGVHLDVHLVEPTDAFPFKRLVTCGMAEAAMTVPEDFGETPFAELTIALPTSWPMSQEAFRDENVYWPVRLLKMLGRLPQTFSTFLWHGHTIPNGDPARPYASGTKLCCALIGPPLLVPDGFTTMALPDGRTVRFLAVIPLYEDEMRRKLERGSDALYEGFEKHALTDVVDPKRTSTVQSRRGFFRR